jgi:sialic acid synthase SpsE
MKPVIIAECAKEHKGNIIVAKDMIAAAKEAKADIVKFQAYDKNDLIDKHPNYGRYLECHLNMGQLEELKHFSDELGIHFFCSVFSSSLLEPMSKITPLIKVPSTYFSHESFIEKCIDNFDQIHISTGFHKKSEVKRHIKKYQLMAAEKEIAFYNCRSVYPASSDELGLSWIKDLGMNGFSYHGRDNKAVLYAIAAGAKYVEIHFTINEDVKPFQYSYKDLRKLNIEIKELTSMFEDVEVSKEERRGYNFFKKEYRTLRDKA